MNLPTFKNYDEFKARYAYDKDLQKADWCRCPKCGVEGMSSQTSKFGPFELEDGECGTESFDYGDTSVSFDWADDPTILCRKCGVSVDGEVIPNESWIAEFESCRPDDTALAVGEAA